MRGLAAAVVALASVLGTARPLLAQSAPSAADVDGYGALQRAAHQGDVDALSALLEEGADVERRDRAGRTPAIIAAFASHEDVLRRLAMAGADLDALEACAYDVVTIAAVANDEAREGVRLAERHVRLLRLYALA